MGMLWWWKGLFVLWLQNWEFLYQCFSCIMNIAHVYNPQMWRLHMVCEYWQLVICVWCIHRGMLLETLLFYIFPGQNVFSSLLMLHSGSVLNIMDWVVACVCEFIQGGWGWVRLVPFRGKCILVHRMFHCFVLKLCVFQWL